MDSKSQRTTTGPLDATEDQRLEALDRYGLRGGQVDSAFDGLVRVAAVALDVPIAFVAMVGRERIWFTSAIGCPTDDVQREGAFCSSAIESDEALVVPDARADERFRNNPMVTGPAGIRFYAGAPVRTPEGHRVGTLCVLDTRVRTLSDVQRDALRALADQASGNVATRRQSVGLRYQKALLELASTDLSHREPAVRRIAETAASVLDVERIGLWFFDESRSSIVAENVYVATENLHRGAADLTAADYPRYFAALEESRTIAAHDARTDSRTSEFNRTYSNPLDVRSMLDVPIRREGRVIGVLCNEQVGRDRVWSADDQEFAASLADLVGTMIEASERRRTEGELRALTATLERRVAERTDELELANRALVQAVSDLEAFCYSVSHDLRAPLRVINGYATMLDESGSFGADTDARVGVLRIRDNTNRMSELLDDLLSFFRLGRRAIDPGPVDLDDVVRETMAVHRLDEAGVEFEFGPLGRVLGDRALLADVFGNLLTNAVKFSARRPAPRVEVGRENRNGHAVIFVRDNGVGFHLDHATRLFEPFQRLHAADGYEGTGVGLAIVRRIVERHGGRVWAESSPSRGSTFRFTLPAGDRAGD